MKGVLEALQFINPFNDKFIFKDFFKNISTILDYLNPFSDNFILKGLLDFINPFSENFFGKKIVELLQKVLEYLFVPNQEMIDTKIESIKSKFAFVDNIKATINEISNIIQSTETSKSLTINIPNNKTGITQLTIIDLKWYEQYKSYGDIVISALVYIFFIWRVYANLSNIVSGVGSMGENIANISKSGKE